MENEKKLLKPSEKKKFKYYNKIIKKSKQAKSILIEPNKSKNLNRIKFKSKKTNKKEQKIKLKRGNRILKIFFNIIGLFLFIISYYFYYLSLEKCFDGEDFCTVKWNWIKLKLMQLIISTAIIIFLMILIIYKIISRLHLAHFTLTFIGFYYYSHSGYFHDHGGFNLIGLFTVLFLSLILLFIIRIIIFIFKIKYKYKIILLIVLFFAYNFITNPTNCDDWPKGLNNTFIENDNNKYGCQIKFPKSCDYKIIEYFQDITKLSYTKCSKKKKDARKKILKYSKSPYVDKHTKKFGYPLTNGDEGKKDGVDDVILKDFTSRNLIDMDKEIPQGLSKPEVVVDFSKDHYGELIINLNYNETLSSERKKLEKNSVPFSDNVLLLYLDSVSRVNGLRKLKKTMNFIEQFISYKGGHNEKYPQEKFHSFQFFKYHSYKGLTSFNFPKLFYGNDKNVKDLKRITKYYHYNGYVMGYASDMCQKDYSRTRRGTTDEETYDHQFLLCDPNKAYVSSPRIRCLYGHLNSYHLYEYINQFWRKYEKNRKLATITINDAHESSLEAVKYTDDVIYNFLNSLYNDNLLKDTTIFLFSDHGSALPSVYYMYEFYQIEMRLPMLFIICNDRKNVDYNQQYFNILENQQTFITAFDIYNTIGNIPFGDNYTNIPNKDDSHDTPRSSKGKSLFEKIDQKERKPIMYQNMDKIYCT